MSVVFLYDPVKRCSEFKDNERDLGGIIKPQISYIYINHMLSCTSYTLPSTRGSDSWTENLGIASLTALVR